MKKFTPAVVDINLLSKLQKKSPALQKKAWGYSKGPAKQFKDVLTTHLITEQDRRCAFCTVRLPPKRNHRDHIAPKGHHPQFTFVPSNLVLACYHCNSVYKLEIDTISHLDMDYEHCEFTIVHPYFDEPSKHITFVGGINKLLVQVVKRSKKGAATINMFKLDDPETTKRRAMEVLLEKNLSHLPGPWLDTLDLVVDAKIYMKIRPAS
jgi:uncharacterized protein (TIGR02646 family)